MSARVLVVEDDGGLRAALCQTLDLSGFPVASAEDGEAAWAALEREDFGLVVSDVQMGRLDGLSLLRRIKDRKPELPVLLMTAFGSIEQAVGAMRDGASDYLVKPFEAQVLVNKVSNLLAEKSSPTSEPVAVDPSSKRLLALAEKVALSDVASVMITGESGTGKEVLARYIHDCSPRRSAPFVAVNCAAIPENMLEAMLFGYEKGAFTGAHKASPGKFEQANGGTVLLDEVSEMAMGLQAKLLRVLQEREVERLGGKDPISLDVRVLATSNCDLKSAVTCGSFREDLFYRLNVFPLAWPPLRDRPLDIIAIAEHLLETQARSRGRQSPRLAACARDALLRHQWPGNVRELDNTLQRALVLQNGPTVLASDLSIEPGEGHDAFAVNAPPQAHGEGETLGDELKHQEFRMIRDSLLAYRGSRKEVAGVLGVSPRTLRYKIARMREAGWDIPA